MTRFFHILLLSVLLTALYTIRSHPLELENRFYLGIRGGKSVHLELDDFESLEIFTDYIYPWENNFIPGFTVHTRTSLSAGILNQEGDTEPLTTLSQLLVLTNSGNDISFDFGAGIGFLGDEKVGNHNFGTNFQFNYNFGVTLLHIVRDFSVGYRLFHLSDGGLGDGQGLNRHTIEFRYDF